MESDSMDIEKCKEALGIPELQKRYDEGANYFTEFLKPMGFEITERKDHFYLESEGKVCLSGPTLIDLFDSFEEIKNRTKDTLLSQSSQ